MNRKYQHGTRHFFPPVMRAIHNPASFKDSSYGAEDSIVHKNNSEVFCSPVPDGEKVFREK